MKINRLLFIFLLAIVFSSCITLQKSMSWSPYIGCSEDELLKNWGYGGNSSFYRSVYGNSKNLWYHKNLLFNLVFPGYSSQSFTINILITIEDGKVTGISTH